MAKGRKINGQKTSRTAKPKTRKKDATLKRWERAEDIPLDDEEQFHYDRDKILLEGDDSGDDVDLHGGQEVFGLKGLEDDTSSEEGLEEVPDDEDDEDTPPASSSSKKTTSSSKASKAQQDSEDEEDAGTWGKGQSAYYVDGDDDVSDEDEEELEKMEEEEAQRLQRKAREDVNEDDYGLAFEDGLEGDNPEEDILDDKPAPPPQPASTKSKAALLKELERTSPEALALARDWEDISEQAIRVEAALKSRDPRDPAMGLMQVHYQTLLTYATTLAFYLHLRASPQYASNPQTLSAHPIMARLLTLKTALAELEGLGFSALENPDEEGDEDEESDIDEEELHELMSRIGVSDKQLKKMKNTANMSRREMVEFMLDVAGGDMSEEEEPEPEPERPTKVKKPSKEKVSKKGKERQQSGVELPTFDLVEPDFESSRKSKSKKPAPAVVEDSDFIEPTSLTVIDAVDKSARQRSLQFHATSIARKTSKNNKKSRAMGGDDDIPYKERERSKGKERDLRDEGWGGLDGPSEDANTLSIDEGKLRTWGKANNSDISGNAITTSDKGKKRARDNEDAEQDLDEYIDLVKSAKKQKKAEKQAAYDGKEAEKREILAEDPVLGPRMLTRNIIRNRGMTRSRTKDIKNTRVKKRMQYEKAKKKLASQRAVYKGGLNAVGGSYGGEVTGINSRVIKSVKFG